MELRNISKELGCVVTWMPKERQLCLIIEKYTVHHYENCYRDENNFIFMRKV